MADKCNYSLKGKKTFFGYPEAKFWGNVVDKDGSRSAEHNLSPIEHMSAPSNLKQLQRVLDLLNQHKNQIPGYGILARPLYDLTG